MRNIFSVILILLSLTAHCQTDSTEIKLQHYKDMFMKGLITAPEYEQLKQKELGLAPMPVQIINVPQKEKNPAIDSLHMNSVQLYNKGYVDAQDYYKKDGGVFGGTLAATLFGGPIIGLAPAIGCSASLNEANLNAPKQDYMRDESYHNGYVARAKHMKRSAAWGAWGAATGIDILVGIVVGTVLKSKGH